MAMTKSAKASRRAFRKRYSRRTARIVVLAAKGLRSRRIAKRLNIDNVMTIAATLANFTRGTYFPYAERNEYNSEVNGTCEY